MAPQTRRCSAAHICGINYHAAMRESCLSSNKQEHFMPPSLKEMLSNE